MFLIFSRADWAHEDFSSLQALVILVTSQCFSSDILSYFLQPADVFEDLAIPTGNNAVIVEEGVGN